MIFIFIGYISIAWLSVDFGQYSKNKIINHQLNLYWYNPFINKGLARGKKSNKSKNFHQSAKNGKIFNRKVKKVKKIQ